VGTLCLSWIIRSIVIGFMYIENLCMPGGLPWGYDPQVAAGFAMDPGHDVGAKPQQVLGVLLFFLDPGTVERVFVFLVVLTIPLWMLLACRKIGLPFEAQLCVLVTLLIPIWLHDNLPLFVFWGMVAFAASCYVAPMCLRSLLTLPTAHI